MREKLEDNKIETEQEELTQCSNVQTIAIAIHTQHQLVWYLRPVYEFGSVSFYFWRVGATFLCMYTIDVFLSHFVHKFV